LEAWRAGDTARRSRGRRHRRGRRSPAHPVAPPSPPPPRQDAASAAPESGSLRETLLLSIPSFFDLVATILMNIGLLSVTASVYQMMRGAEMLFAALFAITFLQ
jgi:hypothetical protein